MQIDWDQLDTEEIEKHIAEGKKVIKQREEKERQETIEKMKEMAAEVGLSVRVTPAKKPKKKKPTPKYRNPKNPKETWTGTGRKPSFIKEAEDRGENIEQFRIESAA